MPASKKAAYVGLSPMTRKAIHDLTAAQAANAPSLEAVHTRADAETSAAAAKPGEAAAHDQGPLLGDQAQSAAATKQPVGITCAAAASASHVAASAAETVKPGAAVKFSQSPTDKAGKTVIKPADRQDSRRDRPAAPHPASSRQAAKRRRSTSTSPSPVRAGDSRASRGRSNAAGHADNISCRRRTRCKTHLMLTADCTLGPKLKPLILTALQNALRKGYSSS